MADFDAQSIHPIVRAPVADVDPVNGASLGATFGEGRWQKVTVTIRELTAGTEPLITVKFSGSDLRWVVYDGDGFTPMFATYSQRTGNVFELLPNGGWHKAPERLWVGEAVEAAI